MNVNEMWDIFKKTGNVNDYIQYARSKDVVCEEKTYEKCSEGDSNKGNIYQ